MAYKGKFRPKRPKKYKGDPTQIIYRSLWERKFMEYCDLNESISQWQSEEFWIPYKNPIDNRMHRYFPDFFIKYKDAKGKKRSVVIEVKPFKQTKPPRKRKKVTQSYLYECKTYATNQAKWEAANEWCKDKRIEFKIITERELGLRS